MTMLYTLKSKFWSGVYKTFPTHFPKYEGYVQLFHLSEICFFHMHFGMESVSDPYSAGFTMCMIIMQLHLTQAVNL